jgi:26S proteasome non-ATPase regulatory subunit 10
MSIEQDDKHKMTFHELNSCLRLSKYFRRQSSRTTSSVNSSGDGRSSCDPISVTPSCTITTQNQPDTESDSDSSLDEIYEVVYANDLEKRLIEQVYSSPTKLEAYVRSFVTNRKTFLNDIDENDCMPLYYAIKAKCLNSIKLLVHYGANLNQTTRLGDPAVHVATLIGSNLTILDYLIELLASQYEVDQEGWTVFHCACNQAHIHIVKYLLTKKYFDINYRDRKSQNTGLHLAAQNNNLSVIKFLLTFSITKHGASSMDHAYRNQIIDINSRNNYGQTPLHLACDCGAFEAVDLMLKSNGSNILDVNLKDFRGRTCLDLAWLWLLSCQKLTNDKSETIEIFYNSHMYIQKQGLLEPSLVDNKIEILGVLCKYGAKFSSANKLFFDFKQFSMSDNPSNSVQFSSIRIPISNYLKCLLYFLKLDFSLNKCFLDPALERNLRALNQFIDAKVLNSFEKEIYFEKLRNIFVFLQKN